MCLKPVTLPLNLYAPRLTLMGWRDRVKAELNKMLDFDMIGPIDEPTEWCFGLTIVTKPNGKTRTCGNMTALNKGIMRTAYLY